MSANDPPRPIRADLVVCRLSAAVSPAGADGEPLRGDALGELETHDGDIWIAMQDGRIQAIGPGYQIRPNLELEKNAPIIDAQGLVAIPGLIDCHTHPCFGGDRVDEFEQRVRGDSYEEIHASGGGILSTVRKTRQATHADLADATERHLRWMLEHGTTTAEAKSGYGLSVGDELKMLRAIETAALLAPQHVSPTLLALHTHPPDGNVDGYLEAVVSELLPEVADEGLATAVDAFVERGSYTVDQVRPFFEAAAERDLAVRMHGDQFAEIGAIDLAISLEARSVDHLEATGEEGVKRLAASNVAAVLLPTAALILRRPMPPARALIDAGAIVALASDLNPGSSFCESLPLVMALAATQMGMTPAESLAACTVNAAHVLGLADVGRLREGYQADIVLLDAPDYRYLAYHLGTHHVRHVICDGQWAFQG